LQENSSHDNITIEPEINILTNNLYAILASLIETLSNENFGSGKIRNFEKKKTRDSDFAQ
jgi:hypothetical protein